MFIYNTGIWLYILAVKAAAFLNSKARLWVGGRKDIFERMRAAIPKGERIIWFHSASLGEFEQGRPLIEAVREQHPEFKILLTFFSPSGYEIRKDYKGADYIFYLPADTPANVRRFMDIANPEIAVFIKYEFWLNYLRELSRRGCRTFVVSAIFRPDSVFFKWYGGPFRKALTTFDHMFVQDEASKELLSQLQISNITVAGDTRFDRVASIVESAPKIEVMKRFGAGSRVMVAGSTWPQDEELLLKLIEAHPEIKYVIAPHEMDRERISRLARDTGALLYSQYTPEVTVEHYRVIIVDTIGILSSLYRYAWCAYIGGGFGVGIHNTLEAATFGLPVAFGPNYARFKEARDMVALGVAKPVEDAVQFIGWFELLDTDPARYDHIRIAAGQYVAANRGATDIIIKKLFA